MYFYDWFNLLMYLMVSLLFYSVITELYRTMICTRMSQNRMSLGLSLILWLFCSVTLV